MTDSAARLRLALDATDPSARLNAAMSAGTWPHDDQVEVLIEQCAVEPDFFVRDMLTWALVRHPVDETLPRLLGQIRDGGPQAKSQALHTLSKIGDPRGWEAITPELLADADEQLVRTAWRAAVVLAPDAEKPAVARVLVRQLGRGDRDLRRSLSRSLATLGDAADDALDAAATSGGLAARQHAIATQRLMLDPDEGFDTAMFEAERALATAPPNPDASEA